MATRKQTRLISELSMEVGPEKANRVLSNLNYRGRHSTTFEAREAIKALMSELVGLLHDMAKAHIERGRQI
jgi:hypothetical protein